MNHRSPGSGGPSPSPTPSIAPKLHLSRRIQHALTGLVLLVVSYVIPPYPVGFVLLSLATAAFYHVHWKRVHDEEWDEWYLDRFGPLLRKHEMGEWERDSDDKSDNTQPNSHDGTSTAKGYKRRRKTPPALPGAFYFLLGTSLSTLLFPTVVARTSLLILSIADPMAGIAGVWFSERLGYNVTWKQLMHKIKGEKNGSGREGGPSIAGSAACAVTTILCTYVYIPAASAGTDSNSTIIPGRDMSLSLKSRLCIGAIAALTEAVAGRPLHIIGATLVDDNLLIPLVVGCSICWMDEARL